MFHLKFLAGFLLLLSLTPVLAQDGFTFRPSNYRQKDGKLGFKKLEELFGPELADLSKVQRTELEKVYKARYDSLVNDIATEHFIFDSPINSYLNEIVSQITRSNPALADQPIRLFINRTAEPNASNWGNGIIMVNTGLIRRFENESQLAFVICHELAHQYLRHVDKASLQYVEKMYGKSTKKEIASISSTEYRRVERAMELMRRMTYESTKHSRFHEAEADSLALIFLQHTPYDATQALTALAVLDSADTEKSKLPLQLKQVFDSPTYPFQDAWLKTSTLLKIEDNPVDNDWNKDSLKTHPDCKKRISLLSSRVQANTATTKKKFLQSEMLFWQMVTQCDFEVVESEFYFKKYANSLLQSILLLQTYPDHPYLQATIGKCFYSLYYAQKNHQMGKYFPLPGPDQSKEYRQLVDFIHNLRLKDVAGIGYMYLKKIQSGQATNEDLLFNLVQLGKAANAGEEAERLKIEYQQKFPAGKYSKEIKQL